MRARAWVLGIAFAFMPATAFAQFAPGARSAGMAGAGLLFARGVDAVEWNPANLARSRGWEVSLYEFGTAGLLTGTSLGDLVEIATAGGDGDGAVVDRLPDGGFTVSGAAEGFVLASAASAADVPKPGSPLPSVGLAFGPLALKVRSRVVFDASMSREIADLTVNGFNPERIQEYAVRETGYRAASFSEITLAYGRSFGDRFSVGAGVRMVKGHSLSQGRFFEPDIDLNDETLDVTGAAVESQGGSGYGFDLGMALDLGAGIRVSLAGSNVFQRMNWDETLIAHEATFSDSDFDDADLADLLDRFSDAEIDAQSVSLPVYEAAQGLFDQSYFPMAVKAGLGWQKRGTNVELVAAAVAPRGRQHNQWDDRLSLGLEQKLKFLTLRAGFTKADEGLSQVAGGFGLGLGPVGLDVGAGRLSGDLNGIDYDGAQVTIALAIRGGGR